MNAKAILFVAAGSGIAMTLTAMAMQGDIERMKREQRAHDAASSAQVMTPDPYANAEPVPGPYAAPTTDGYASSDPYAAPASEPYAAPASDPYASSAP